MNKGGGIAPTMNPGGNVTIDGTIVCLGDSIAASGWPEALEKILHDHGRREIRVFNAGIRGNTSTQGLNRLDRDVLKHRPGLVFVQFGFNDCNVILNGPRPRTDPARFRENLITLVTRIREGCARPTLIANHPTLMAHALPDGRTYEEHSQDYSAITVEVAAQTDTPLIDMRRLFPGPGLSLADALVEDGIHLSAAGIERYARVTADYLLSGS